MDVSNDELLAKIHKVSLYILLAFDKVCRENDLTYFLDSGTALGAVRHGGFIPWDDDVDVGMPRKDYERFLQIGQEKLPGDLFIQTRETDPAYKRHAAKLRLKGTILQEYEDFPYAQNGFFIDIFPFDNVPKNRYVAQIRIAVSRYIYYIVRTKWSMKSSPVAIRRIVGFFIKKIPEFLIKWLDKKYIAFCRAYEDIETGYVTCYSWLMTQQKTYIFKSDKIYPVRDISFEGHSVKIMNCPTYYLEILYGDYLTLPPESERHCHHLKGLIDFGPYA